MRSARSAALCGMLLARGGRFFEAEEAFTRASRFDDINLTVQPGFWDLPRAGMQAAVRAYESNQRYREASALAAKLRLLYRPRVVRNAPTPIRPEINEATGS